MGKAQQVEISVSSHRSIVKGELKEHKAETVALWESHAQTVVQETKTHMVSVEGKQSDFLAQLASVRDKISNVLYNMLLFFPPTLCSLSGFIIIISSSIFVAFVCARVSKRQVFIVSD